MQDSRRYRILSVLGSGGFGKVYKARMEGANGFVKDVAIKLLKPETIQDGVLERFRDEARILGLIRDRAIIQVDPPAQLGGRWAVVMEFVDGLPLSRLLRLHKVLPPKVALQVTAEVARALEKAVNQLGPSGEPLRLIHRDLKPANLQMTSSGEIKILDFGIARADFDSREMETVTGITGTPGYIAPERFDGIEDPIGDIYSLGTVLMRLLTGKKPGAELPEDASPDLIAAMGFARTLRQNEPDLRPDASVVEQQASELASKMGGERLRDWARQNVPAGIKLSDDELCGSILTQSFTIAADDMPPEEEPTRLGTRVAAVGVVGALGATIFVVCAGVGALMPTLISMMQSDTTAAITTAQPDLEDPSPPEPAPVAAQVAEEEPIEEEPIDEEPIDEEPAPTPKEEPPSKEPAEAKPTPRPEASPPVAEPEVPVEQPEPEPKATLGITIGSKPWGRKIYVDGQPMGSAPKDLQLTVGEHRIALDDPAGPSARAILVQEGQNTRYVWNQTSGSWEVHP